MSSNTRYYLRPDVCRLFLFIFDIVFHVIDSESLSFGIRVWSSSSGSNFFLLLLSFVKRETVAKSDAEMGEKDDDEQHPPFLLPV